MQDRLQVGDTAAVSAGRLVSSRCLRRYLTSSAVLSQSVSRSSMPPSNFGHLGALAPDLVDGAAVARDGSHVRSACSTRAIARSIAARASHKAIRTSARLAGCGVVEITNTPTPGRRPSNPSLTKVDCACRIMPSHWRRSTNLLSKLADE